MSAPTPDGLSGDAVAWLAARLRTGTDVTVRRSPLLDGGASQPGRAYECSVDGLTAVLATGRYAVVAGSTNFYGSYGSGKTETKQHSWYSLDVLDGDDVIAHAEGKGVAQLYAAAAALHDRTTPEARTRFATLARRVAAEARDAGLA